MIETIKRNIDASLRSFLQDVAKSYRLRWVSPILFDSLKDFTLRPGKRIRPLLLILSYLGYKKKGSRLPRNLYNASTCIELLHNFMLIHDDIIDRSNLRRGKPTLHRLLGRIVKTEDREKLGYDLGIIAGDIVYALAIDAFLAINEAPKRKERALKYFIQTAAFTAMGEFIDTLHGVERINRVKEKDVFLNYTLKTARYTFDCPLVVGAIRVAVAAHAAQTVAAVDPFVRAAIHPLLQQIGCGALVVSEFTAFHQAQQAQQQLEPEERTAILIQILRRFDQQRASLLPSDAMMDIQKQNSLYVLIRPRIAYLSRRHRHSG